MKSKPIIWVEGLIGAGKTTLATALAERLNLRALFEPIGSNPYLKDFYCDQKRWAFPMQIELMMRRYAMQKTAAYEAVSSDSQWSGCVLDRGLPGDRVFCRLHMLHENMSHKEWETYERAYEIMACSITPPSLLIFLDIEPEVALQRVVERNRDAEKGLPLKYLQDLRAGYLDLLVEIESGTHAWSRGMEVKRIPWNVGHQPIEPIVNMLIDKYKLEER